ncbi:helix-turn-helix domain-containing protein, partial [Microbacterium sp. UBA837]|uniref:helix-turn-helix domain-containing protein n=1 Tax=Microbacterium sp. UBA837 TaxID=1946956 RepID=UPI0025E9446E
MTSSQLKRSFEPGTLPVWGFSDKIRKARDITGLGQKDFAARIDLTASTLAAYETGRSAPRFNDAPSLAKRLQLLTGIPADWFLVVDDPNAPSPVGPAGIEPTTSTV